MTDGFRIQQLERDVQSLEERAAVIPVLETKIENMGREIGEIKKSMVKGFDEQKDESKSTRRVLLGFAFTIAVSAIGVVFAVLSAGGGS